jgi:hypothetical protein
LGGPEQGGIAVASYSHLRKIAAQERAAALEVLDELLPEDSPSRVSLEAAQHDVVASKEWEFQVNTLVGALARVVAAQQEQIAELREAVPKRAARAR